MAQGARCSSSQRSCRARSTSIEPPLRILLPGYRLFVMKIPVGILGATGSVGQRLVQLLADHPWFEVAEVVASDRSAGKCYGEAAEWRLTADMPGAARELVVKDYNDDRTRPVAFSALPGEFAGEMAASL